MALEVTLELTVRLDHSGRLSDILHILCFLAAAGLRTPLAVPGPYPAPFGMVPHAGMNGELTSPGAAYASLHNMSPQMSAAAAAAAVVAYGRSPMVGATDRHAGGQAGGCTGGQVSQGQDLRCHCRGGLQVLPNGRCHGWVLGG